MLFKHLGDVQAKIEKQKAVGQVLDISPFPHPEDDYLFYVLGQTVTGGYTNWLYNSNDDGLHEGHYFDASEQGKTECLKDYAQRIEKLY